MVKVKPIDRVVKKWEERASVATDEYKAGVENPKQDWQKATEDAFPAWQTAIQEAIRNRTFIGGVRKAGTEKWRRGALEKGADRYSSGVRAAVDEYRDAMGEVLRVMEGVTLPARGPKGDPKNYDRVKAIGEALHKYKVAKKKA